MSYSTIALNNNILLLLHLLNTILNIRNQFFQKLYLCCLIWEIVGVFFKFALDQVANREFPSQTFLVWGYIKIVIVHIHHP